MNLNLKGRVAVITGPAKGMGAAITMAFAAEGTRLSLIGRDIAAIEPVAQEARAAGTDAIVVPCDLTDPKQCEHAAHGVEAAVHVEGDDVVELLRRRLHAGLADRP